MEKVQLGEVLKYEQPTKYLIEKTDYDDSYETPVLTAGKSFILGYTNEQENIFKKLPVIIFDDFTTATQYVDFPFKVKSSAMKILNPVKEKADVKYLYYLIQNIPFDPERHKRYWISEYSKIKIPLPDLETQKAIAAKLDAADALRQKDQELLEQYNLLAQSIFIEMFGDPVLNEKGWERKKGQDIAKRITVGVVIKPASHYVDNGVIALRSLNIKPNSFSLTNVVFFSEEKNNTILKKSKLFKGDVVIVRTGNTGTAAVITEKLDGVNCIDLLILNPKTQILNSYYFSYLLNSEGGKTLYAGKQVGGIQKHLNVSVLRDVRIPVPPISLQTQFAEKIKNIEAQKALVQQQAEQSEMLFQTLLQESFAIPLL